MINNLLANLSVQQLRRAVAIKEQMTALEAELSHIFGTSSLLAPVARRGRRSKRRSKLPAMARGRMSAAQKARWAKQNGMPTLRLRKQARRKLSARARARLSALARARWARAKAAGRKTLGG